MRARLLPLFLLAASFFLPPTLQVNVRHSFFRGDATCTNLASGVCCLAIPLKSQRIYPGDTFPDYLWLVEFSNLFADEIAFVWEKRGEVEGCSGMPVRTMIAPPSIFHIMRYGDYGSGVYKRFTGASYIKLSKKLPPDSATSLWLGAEGMLGLAWGGVKWISERGKSAGILVVGS